MVRDRTPITSQKLTPEVGIPTYFRPDSARRHTIIGSWIKGVFNGWIQYWNHHPHHWWTNFYGMSQKRGIIGDPHNIMETSDHRAAKLGWPSITPKIIRESASFIAQHIFRLQHPDSLTTVITTHKKELTGVNHTKECLSPTKNKNGKTGIPNWQYQSWRTSPPLPQQGTSSQDYAM